MSIYAYFFGLLMSLIYLHFMFNIIGHIIVENWHVFRHLYYEMVLKFQHAIVEMSHRDKILC